MSERYTKADVGRILVNVNATAERLGMAGAGSYTVETMGGTYLYLTDRRGLGPEHTGPGRRMVDLGKSWSAAGATLIGLLQAWHLVEMYQAEAGVTA